MWQTLLGVIVGGLISLGAWTVQDFSSAQRRRRSLKAALAAEIGSIVELIERQGYADELRRAAQSIATLTASTDFDYSIPIGQSYFTIYEANATTLGELEPQIASTVVRFYQGAKSLVDTLADRREGIVFYRAEKAEMYRHIADALDELCELGTNACDKLVPNHKIRLGSAA